MKTTVDLRTNLGDFFSRPTTENKPVVSPHVVTVTTTGPNITTSVKAQTVVSGVPANVSSSTTINSNGPSSKVVKVSVPTESNGTYVSSSSDGKNTSYSIGAKIKAPLPENKSFSIDLSIYHK